MIEKLHSHPVYTSDGLGITGLIRPSTSEIVDKLNEIIDIINQLYEQCQKGAENE